MLKYMYINILGGLTMGNMTTFMDFEVRKSQKEHLQVAQQKQDAELDLAIRNYNEALAEAVVYQKNDQTIPEEIITKAIGRRPSSNLDTPDMDTMIMQLEEIRRYQKNRKLFHDKVISASKKM